MFLILVSSLIFENPAGDLSPKIGISELLRWCTLHPSLNCRNFSFANVDRVGDFDEERLLTFVNIEQNTSFPLDYSTIISSNFFIFRVFPAPIKLFRVLSDMLFLPFFNDCFCCTCCNELLICTLGPI